MPMAARIVTGPVRPTSMRSATRKTIKPLLDKLRGEMRLTLKEARETACVECHDLDNSPDFVKEGGFDEYWPHIEH